MGYHTLEKLILSVAESIRPPEKLEVSESSEKYRYLNNPGSYVGPWDNSIAPYLVEIQNETTSLDSTAVIFAGPARCGKSDIFFNYLTHTVVCDPADMLLVHMTQGTARDWSIGDLKKNFRNSVALGSRVMPGRQNMNVHDIQFMSGMRLLIKWPTITELSGKTIPRHWLMDYDRMPADVDKEGTPFDLTRKRGQTFGRNAMTVAESSPGYEVINPKWIAETPHQAPPTEGILALYNRGDRRRWYWRCHQCETPFEGDFKHLSYDESIADLRDRADSAVMVCPDCGFPHTHESGEGQPGKHGLNLKGKWIKDGQKWEADGSVSGTAPRTDISSFWLKGVAAAFVSWSDIVYKYLLAMEEYENTQSTKALKATVNTDQGLPFSPPRLVGDLDATELKDRSKNLGELVVPPGVRFLVATIDVQKNRFVVQVHGITEGFNITVIDRFSIKKSLRKDDDGDRQLINPAAYLEDWQMLVDEVLEKTYPVDDNSGRRMKIRATACDSGGRKGVTPMAYDFWRWLRDKHPAGHHTRFQLVKGASQDSAPRVRISYPDSDRKDRSAGARGEIPVMLINANMLKDRAFGMLQNREADGGSVIFPNWLPSWFYTELTVEVRGTKGWENSKKLRNESWDLLVYCIAMCVSQHCKIEHIDWEDAPSWASTWDFNDHVFNPNSADAFHVDYDDDIDDLEALGEALA